MLRGPLISRRAGVAAALATVLIFLGCMSFEGTHVDRTEIIPPPEIPSPNLVADGLIDQNGRASVSGNCELDIYYPIPFFGPPNLTLEGDNENVKIMYQRRDHFRVKNTCANEHYSARINWQARGVKALIAPPPPPVTLSSGKLPSEPVPVSQP